MILIMSSGFSCIFKDIAPPLPGLYFGMVFGLAVWFLVSRSAWKTITVLLSTVIACRCKLHGRTCFSINSADAGRDCCARQTLDDQFTPDDQIYVGRRPGCSGAGRKHYIDIWPLARLQRIRSIAKLGTHSNARHCSGCSAELIAKDNKGPLDNGSILPLFIAWQVTVAAVIGSCIVPRLAIANPYLSRPRAEPRGRQGRQYQHRRLLGRSPVERLGLFRRAVACSLNTT